MGAACLPALECVRGQLQSFASELRRMHGLEFPYDHSRQAIVAVERTSASIRRYVDALDKNSDPATIASICQAAQGYLEDSLRILGFILRSTNVRNAFEVHGPMLRLTRLILGPDAKLLLSSEWELSPFLLLGARVLPADYVLIGQPATESANPFLLPLAGHELAHSVWAKRKLQGTFDKICKNLIAERLRKRWHDVVNIWGLTCKPSELENDLTGNAILSEGVDWCCRQIEETFCDVFGVRLFGTSYFYAFAYLLAPINSSFRTPIYPEFIDRAAAQLAAAELFGYNAPDSYGSLFAPSASAGKGGHPNFLLGLVDEVRRYLLPRILSEVQIITQEAGLPSPDVTAIRRCCETLKHFVPCFKAPCLADITNAAWEARLTDHFFPSVTLETNKNAHLCELILKSIEVFEIEQCQAALCAAQLKGANP